jgi:hypothetical protein
VIEKIREADLKIACARRADVARHEALLFSSSGCRRLLCEGQWNADCADAHRSAQISVQFWSVSMSQACCLFRIKKEINMNNDLTIWYSQAAEEWCDALPLGNGRLGAMIYGGACAERIYLSDSTFWSGEPSLENNNPHGPAIIVEVRRLLLAGEIAAANQLSEQIEGRKLNYGTNLPFGNLRLMMAHGDEGLRDYRRELDLDTGIVSVSYELSGTVSTSADVCSWPRRRRLNYDAGYAPVQVTYCRETIRQPRRRRVLVMRITCEPRRRAGVARAARWRRTAIYGLRREWCDNLHGRAGA